MRELKFKEVETVTALSKSGLPELKYALNPYMGCQHGCIYCYAMDFTNDSEAAQNWGSVIAVKKNIVSVLKRDIGKYHRGIVGVSTVTDPYQPVEGKYKLTRQCIDLLSRNGFHVSIQTRSPLVIRDLDILADHSRMFDMGMTMASPEASVTKILEPGAPPPKARMHALGKASGEGVETWMFLGPIVKGFNDTEEQFHEVFEFASGIGSRIIYDKFSPYKGPLDLMREILPGGSDSYTSLADRDWWKSTTKLIAEISEKFSVESHPQSEDWMFEKKRFVRQLTDFS